MSTGKTLLVDPSRAVADPHARDPEQLLMARRDADAQWEKEETNAPAASRQQARATGIYEELELPSETVIVAVTNVYAPGVLAMAGSDGGLEVARLKEAVLDLREVIGRLRRSLWRKRPGYEFPRAVESVPPFALTMRLLAGLCHARPLEPKTFSKQLKKIRLEAALTLVTAGSQPLTRALSAKLGADNCRENLALFYAGITRRPYPLELPEAAEETEWFSGVRIAHVPPEDCVHCSHFETSQSSDEMTRHQHCPHCQAPKPSRQAMSNRKSDLRRALIEAIWPGVSLPDLIPPARR
jgi:hypothetical protein